MLWICTYIPVIDDISVKSPTQLTCIYVISKVNLCLLKASCIMNTSQPHQDTIIASCIMQTPHFLTI